MSILNDTSRAVVLDDCLGAYCRLEQDSLLLVPGQRTSVNAAFASSGRDMTSWRLKGGGMLLGYIAVNTARKHDGLVFVVSHASRNRSTATPVG